MAASLQRVEKCAVFRPPCVKYEKQTIYNHIKIIWRYGLVAVGAATTVQYNTVLALITCTQSTARAESEVQAVSRGKMVWWH